MRAFHSSAETSRRQSGYALLVVVFLAAAVLIAVAAAAPRLLVQGQREKEEELIWRGEQYARAVRLYYRKYGRFPQSLEDLTKPKDQIHFLRKAYTDPMNAKDGSWRLIYIGPGGQLIGSVRRQALGALPGIPAPQGAPVAPPVISAEAPPQGAGQPAPAPPATPAAPTPPASSAMEVEGKVFGGNIIGVASKVNRPSIRVYDGASTYREWEFIWDPTKDVIGAGQPVAPAAAPVGKPANPSTQPSPTPPLQ